MLLCLVCGALVTASGVPAQTMEDRREACFRAAFEKYYLANVEILGFRPLVASKARLQQRQLQEVYCALFARGSIMGHAPLRFPVSRRFRLASNRKRKKRGELMVRSRAKATGGPAVASQGCWQPAYPHTVRRPAIGVPPCRQRGAD